MLSTIDPDYTRREAPRPGQQTVTRSYHPFVTVDEEVRSRQPFEAWYTFTADDEALTLTVDGDLTVVDTTRNQTSAFD